MLRVYFDWREANRRRRLTPSYVKEDTGLAYTNALDSALEEVIDYLRDIGISRRQVYIPRMFDSLDLFQTRAVSAAHTSPAIQPTVNETRFVLTVASRTAPATITIEGSDDGSNWFTTATLSIDGEPGTFSTRLLDGSQYVRYTISPEDDITYSPFLVDTSLDLSIIYKACEIVLFPHINGDSNADEMYHEVRQLYAQSMSKVIADIDTDNDGSIDSYDVSRNTTGFIRLVRG